MPEQFMKDLGVYFGTSLTMERQVNAIFSAYYYHIHDQNHFRQYITTNASYTKQSGLYLLCMIHHAQIINSGRLEYTFTLLIA